MTANLFVVLCALCLSRGAGDSVAELISSRIARNGAYVPLTYKINPRSKDPECLYDRFAEGDKVTFSVFVIEALQAGPPIATITFEGPVAGNDDVLKLVEQAGAKEATAGKPSLGRELRVGALTHWPLVRDADRTAWNGHLQRSVRVDWTHAGDEEDAVAMRDQLEREKRAAYRDYGRGPSRGDGDWEEVRDAHRGIFMPKIAPHEETFELRAGGWFRLCVAGKHSPLLVEMEMRSGARLGGVDPETKHVYSHDARQWQDADKALDLEMRAGMLDSNTYGTSEEEKAKELENQVRERDLHATQSQIKHLNSLVKVMEQKQTDSYRRVRSHTASARRNHSNLMWSGKLETLLYIAITGVQVYTLRKWLLGNSLLGK